MLLATACASVSNPEGWAGPRLEGDTLYVSTDKGKLAALDPEDLSQRWVFPPDTKEGDRLKLEGIYGAPAVSNDTVYFGAYDGFVYALNAEDGTPKWRFETGDAIVNTVALADDGTLYVGSTDGKLYAIDTSKCVGDCHKDTESYRAYDTGSSIWGSPLVTDELIYVPTMDGRLHALIAGDLIPTEGFHFKADAGLLTDIVMAKENILLVGGITEELYAVDAETGDQVWETPVGAGNWFWGRPLIDDDTIYVPNLDGTVRALDSGGNELWDAPFKANASIRATPVLADGTLVIIDKDGRAYGVDPKIGTLEWGSIETPVLLNKTILSDPLLLEDGELLVVAQGGDLIRIDPTNGASRSVEALP